MVEDGDLDLLVVGDTRPGDAWHAGSARRGCGGAGSTNRAAKSTMRCAKGRVFHYVANVPPLDPE